MLIQPTGAVPPLDVLGRPIAADVQSDILRDRTPSIARDVKADMVRAKDTVAEQGRRWGSTAERKVNEFGEALKDARQKAEEKAYDLGEHAVDLSNKATEKKQAVEENIKEHVLDMKDLVGGVADTVDTWKEKVVDFVKEAEPHRKVDIIFQHSKHAHPLSEVKERTSSAWEKTEDKDREVGETIRDSAASAKETIVDTSRRAGETLRRAGESVKDTAISARDTMADTSRKVADAGERIKDNILPRRGKHQMLFVNF
jgi:hypothetical protein